ncbi:MAG: YceI family protein [Gemmatimonadaceae bacterium]|nr:YceI family protein [Gemmatimonadaceae bacterium]
MPKMSLLALFAMSALAIPAARAGEHAIATPGTVRYIVAPDGNEARYRVREQLMHHDLPNDAVGKTTAITGAISIGANGAVDSATSKITIDVTSLKSDQERRDGYLQHRTLETAQYPTVVFVPTAVTGAKLPIAGAEQSLDVAGLLTVHGVTKPTVWHVKAKGIGNDVTGSGWTQFTFADVSLPRPSVPILLSVADTIRLEYDFHLVRER